MTGIKYCRLTLKEREEISRWLAIGKGTREIGKFLSRHPSTISREIRKGGCNKFRYTYRAAKAERRAIRNASKRKRGKSRLAKEKLLRLQVIAWLRQRWSPEQIAVYLEKVYPMDMNMRISPESIYRFVYVLPKGKLKAELIASLRREHRRRHRRRKSIVEATKELEDILSIEQRPKEVESREIPGHWEGDLMIGKNRQSAIGTLVERKTRYLMLVKLRNKTSEEVLKQFSKRFGKLPRELRKSMTYDQGGEMAKHKQLEKEAEITIYFVHKGSPWERGTNENTNGLLRQFFPHGVDFNKVSQKEINKVERLMNGRPRKTLGYDTPEDVFSKSVALDV